MGKYKSKVLKRTCNRELSGNRNVYKQQADAVGQIANRLDNKGIN